MGSHHIGVSLVTRSRVLVLGKRRDAAGGGGFLIGLDRQTGRQVYTFESGHNITLLHYDGNQVVVGAHASLAIDPVSGERRWRFGR